LAFRAALRTGCIDAVVVDDDLAIQLLSPDNTPPRYRNITKILEDSE
jgi:hypothetical protein